MKNNISVLEEMYSDRLVDFSTSLLHILKLV